MAIHKSRENMVKQAWIFTSTLCFIVVGLVIGSFAQASETSLTNSRPNIIFVLTDDQGMGDLSGQRIEITKIM